MAAFVAALLTSAFSGMCLVYGPGCDPVLIPQPGRVLLCASELGASVRVDPGLTVGFAPNVSLA